MGTITVQRMDHVDSLVGTCFPCGRDGQPRPGPCPVGLSWEGGHSSALKESSRWVPGGLDGAGGARRAKEYVSLGSRVCVWMWGQGFAVEML